MFEKAQKFLNYDVWRIRARRLPKGKSIALRTLRVFILSLKEFNRDNCSYAASALTFYSLLSIVPVFAMAFGVAKGFGLEQNLQGPIMERFHGQEEVITRLIEFSQSFLQNTKGGVIAGVGVAFLIWTIIRLFTNIERAFNEIWGVTTERTLGRKFTDYLSLFFIGPLLLVISGSLTVYITTEVQGITNSIKFVGYFYNVIIWVLGLIPILIIWGLLIFLYVFMPNTRVNLRSAVVGGIVGGIIYQIVQTVYINFQIGVSNYGAVYGSFAALPLFLMWLQLSWLIVLYGAEIAFAHQNDETYEFEPDSRSVSPSFRQLLALAITRLIVDRFRKGEVPAHLNWIANHLEMPVRLVRQVAGSLEQAGLLIEVEPPGRKDRDEYYAPARPLEELTSYCVLSALEKTGADSIPLPHSEDLEKLIEALKKMDDARKASPGNIPLDRL